MNALSRIRAAGLSLLLSAALAVSPAAGAGFRARAESAGAAGSAGNGAEAAGAYADYLALHPDAPSPAARVVVPAWEGYRAGSGAEVSVKPAFQGKKALVWQGGGAVEWTFRVEKTGYYRLRLSYYVIDDETRNVRVKMQLDGKTGFSEQNRLTFPRLYRDGDEIRQDSTGNDMRPDQTAAHEWLEQDAQDVDGVTSEPLRFYLTAGEHTLRFADAQTPVALESAVFYNDAPLPEYSDYAAEAKPVSDGFGTTVQAERADVKSDAVLYPTTDRTSADTTPSDPLRLKLNTIGGKNYATVGQFIVWKVTVPQDGYYKIGMRVRQNLSVGLTSYRRLYVNGRVPFRQADSIPFHFGRKWQNVTLGEQDGGWLFHLKAGENELKLEVVPGPTAAVTDRMDRLVSQLNLIYRQIIMVTGTSPDPYRDYQLDKEIPGLTDEMKQAAREDQSVIDEAKKSGNDVAGSLSSLSELLRLLNGCIDDPGSIPVRASKIQSYYSTVSALITSVRTMPLELDSITVFTKSDGAVSGGFWSQVLFGFESFVGSFVVDYNTVGSTGGSGKKITVWVNLGRDQTQIVKTLATSSFTPKTGVSVRVELVQQSLVQAALSGRGPDVVLFVAEGDPVNLAMRGALVPLDGFPTYRAVESRFHSSASVPFRYQDAVYAVPVEQNFPMLFYRTDIFSELKLSPPKTWDDFYNVIQALQHNNMTAGLPNMPSDSQMTTNNKIFAMFLQQSGGSFYNRALSRTNLDSIKAVDAFSKWTDFYRSYGLPYQFDFYNRFRTGQMPIGIDSYTLYNKLMTAAPEIQGLWKMEAVPGTEAKDGTVNGEVCGTVTAAVMMSRCKDRQSAWKFIDWFTRADIQTAFGLEIETLLGPAGRYDTANLEAFGRLPWTQDEKKSIGAQWNHVFMLPQVPGGYYVDRDLTNAFRRVVFYGENPRETLLNYNEDIDSEIRRKRVEFGLE